MIKKDVGQDVIDKIKLLYSKAKEKGLTDRQALIVLAMADHESAGTWSENVIGDNGCSKGIGQWNACTNMDAPVTYEEQAQLLVDQMHGKFQDYPEKTAITKHNCPACWERPKYYEKVYHAMNNFTN